MQLISRSECHPQAFSELIQTVQLRNILVVVSFVCFSMPESQN